MVDRFPLSGMCVRVDGVLFHLVDFFLSLLIVSTYFAPSLRLLRSSDTRTALMDR